MFMWVDAGFVIHPRQRCLGLSNSVRDLFVASYQGCLTPVLASRSAMINEKISRERWRGAVDVASRRGVQVKSLPVNLTWLYLGSYKYTRAKRRRHCAVALS
jgi:hypothetical protein